jgi:hypothetical protein
VIAARTAGLQHRRVKQQPDQEKRAAQQLAAPPTNQRLARIQRVQTQDHPHRGRLPSPVGIRLDFTS